MSNQIKIWFQGIRGPFLVASAIPVFFGGAYAALYVSHFNWFAFALALLGIIMVHAASNMSNDYFDYLNKTDIINKNRTIFSGGSGVLVTGIISLRQHKVVFATLYLLTGLIGIALAVMAGSNWWVIVLFAITGFVLTYYYSSPPISFANRGLGEIVVGLCFGPLPVLGTFIVLTGRASILPAILSIPIMMLIIAVLYINQFPDAEADSAVDKRNLVVRLGRSRARFGYYLLIFITYFSILLFIILKMMPWHSIFAMLTLPLAIKSSMVLHRHYDEPKGVFPAMGMTILTHHLTGILLTGSLILEKFIK
jgi:1,4-dihydroxy-2-naphthoate polyprenyltransferase